MCDGLLNRSFLTDNAAKWLQILEVSNVRTEAFEGRLQENGPKMCKTNGHVWYVADSSEERFCWKEMLPKHVEETLLCYFEKTHKQVNQM